MIRRIIALTLALSYAAFSLELAVADVHDGDASAAEVASLALPGINAAAVTPSSSSDDSSGQRAPLAANHTTHACHCVHAHGSLTAAATEIPQVALVSVGKALASAMLAPSSVDLDAHFRPPIA